jgi:hypothetical protein
VAVFHGVPFLAETRGLLGVADGEPDGKPDGRDTSSSPSLTMTSPNDSQRLGADRTLTWARGVAPTGCYLAYTRVGIGASRFFGDAFVAENTTGPAPLPHQKTRTPPTANEPHIGYFFGGGATEVSTSRTRKSRRPQSWWLCTDGLQGRSGTSGAASERTHLQRLVE